MIDGLLERKNKRFVTLLSKKEPFQGFFLVYLLRYLVSCYVLVSALGWFNVYCFLGGAGGGGGKIFGNGSAALRCFSVILL